MRTGVCFEHPPDAGVIVDFPVEDDPDAAILVRQRLLTATQVDDAQAAMREECVVVAVEARVVRAAMSQHVTHPDGSDLVVRM